MVGLKIRTTQIGLISMEDKFVKMFGDAVLATVADNHRKYAGLNWLKSYIRYAMFLSLVFQGKVK